MNNVYDILLNFSKDKAYQFFEWSEHDNIEHIKKIPIIRVSDSEMIKVVNNNVKIKMDLLNRFYNKTEKFVGNQIFNIPYAFIVGNTNEAYALKFNKYGYEVCRSNFILDEKDEILELFKNIKIENFCFDVVRKIKSYDDFTRYELDNRKRIRNNINKIYKEADIGKLKYIYYEINGETENDISIIYNNLIKIVNSDWSEKHIHLIEIFKLLNVKRQL